MSRRLRLFVVALPLAHASRHPLLPVLFVLGCAQGSTTSSDDWWDDVTEETVYSITVPAGGRLQLVLCSAQTNFDARLALLSDPPSELYDTAAPLRESADPILLNCDLNDNTNTAPIDAWGLSGGR